MRSDHLGQLVLGAGGAQEIGRGEMQLLALLPCERVVGDPANEVLEEAVLPVLGRPRVGVQREHFFPHERGEQRLELGLGHAGQAGERLRA